jgi:nucleoid DNA-binding protein
LPERRLSFLDITAIIRELLFGYDCVILPGFGGFIGNRIPSRIDDNTSTFYPPLKQISFNRNLNYNDGLLIGKISQKFGISYIDARGIVDDFVSNVRIRMARGEKILFDRIGSFYVNRESNIQFEPDMNSNYDLDSYGLESFQRDPREGYDSRRRIFRRFDRDPEKRARIKKILIRAAVAIPIIAVLVLVPLKTDIFKPARVESVTMNPLAKAELEENKSVVDQDLASGFGTEEGIANVDENIAAYGTDLTQTPEPTYEAPVPQQSAGNLLIITGSFKSRENAASQVDDLSNQGFKAEIIAAQNGYFRVSAMRCSDMETAETNRSKLLSKYPGAWISKN